MRKSEHRYASFVHDLDLDTIYAELEFEPIRQGTNKRGEPEDIGHCLDPWQLHKRGDTTGKLAINPESKLWNCWVCGGGTLLSLVMAVKGITDQEAEEWLAQFATEADLDDQGRMHEIEEIHREELLRREKRAKPTPPWFNERVLEPWEANLPQIEGWLKSRGISIEAAQKARVGYSAASPRLAPENTGTPRSEPYVGPCVYLPHFWGERLVGWQQRWLDEDRPRWVPKYSNTSNFPKTDTLYNFENVYLAERPVIVVESVPTVLFLMTLGYPAVATFGGSVTEEQMRLLRRFTQGIVLAPDNDRVGHKWLGYTEAEKRYQTGERTVLAEYLQQWVPVKVIEPIGDFNSGADLGDLIEEGLPFAARVVRMLYDEAEYY